MRIEVDLPDGWQRHSERSGTWMWVHQGISITEVGFYVVDNLYLDPCMPELGWQDPPIGPSPEDLVTELLSLPAYEESTFTASTLGGHPATHIVTPNVVNTMWTPTCDDDNVYGQIGYGTRNAAVGLLALGQYPDAWIVDVDGERLLVVAQDGAGKAAELDAVIESAQIEP